MDLMVQLVQYSKIRSSYAKRVQPNPGLRPSTFPDGFFLNDYYFDRAIGDLDEFNGRFCKTPEYPDGIYAILQLLTIQQLQNQNIHMLLVNSLEIMFKKLWPNFNQTISIESLNLMKYFTILLGIFFIVL